MFHLNVGYDSDDLSLCDVTDVDYGICRTLRCFKRHYKGTVQERLTIFISFCSKFTAVHVCQIRAWFDKVIAKIKICIFLTHIVIDQMADKTFGVPWLCDGLPWAMDHRK